MIATQSDAHAASRLRAVGGDRMLAVDMLMNSGETAADAEDMVNQFDYELGLAGLPLPDDIAPLVIRRLHAHQLGQIKASVHAAASLPKQRRHHRPMIEAFADKPLAPRTAGPVSASDRHALLADAMKSSAQGARRMDILDAMLIGGLSESEAIESLTAIEEDLRGKRQSFSRTRTRVIAVALLQITLGLTMLLVGEPEARVFALILFASLAIRGVTRLFSLRRHTFADFVLAGRDEV